MSYEQAKPTAGKRTEQGTEEKKKRQQQALRQQQQAAGLEPRRRATPSNRCSPYQSIDQEREARTQATTEQARLLNANWPVLLRRLRQIPDIRHPKKTKHKLTTLMLYGILVFVLQYTSRRQANGEMSRPMFEQNLRSLFPELDTLPHADTLFRLLSTIDVDQIEQAQIDLVNQLVRKEKFTPYRINNCYPIAIDGTQKIAFATLWTDQLQQRKLKPTQGSEQRDPQYQYYVYVLEANLSFQNGMVMPLILESPVDRYWLYLTF